MLGLSLAIRVGKRVLGGLIDSLMSAVKGRATYSENIADSKQVLKDIDNYELLDKASILLTPTAYSDARVHSVKTYTGDELVTNGTYSTDLSGWTNTNTHWQWSSGSAYHPLTASFNPLKQDITNNVGAVLRITFDLTYVQGTAQCFYKNEATSDVSTTFTSSGSYTIITEPVKANTEINFGRAFGHNTEFYIDNVSVLDVSSDFDFDRASSATRINSSGLVQDMQSITDPELVLNGDFEELGNDIVTNGTFDTDSDWTKSSQSTISNGTARILSTDGSFQFLKQSGYTSTQGETVKITIDIVDVQSGQLKVFFDGGANTQNIPSTVGTHTVYLVNDGTVGTLAITRISGVTDITIDNISIKQVDPNDRWTLGTGWSIEDGVAIYTGTTNANLSESGILTSGNLYELNYEVINSTLVGGIVKLSGETATAQNVLSQTVGTHKLYFTADGTSPTDFNIRVVVNTSGQFEIDNVSVKDITFSEDVDLARINYDSNGDNGHWLLEPTSTNLVTYSEDFSDSSWAKTNCTINSNNSISPEGTQNADKLDFTTSSGEIVRTTSFVSGQEYTMSFYAKTESGTLDFNYGNMDYTMNSGTATTEWQRFEITQTLPSATRFPKIQTTEIGSLLLWGFQIEQLSYATSYIPTYGSTVTRATETLNGSGNSTLINSTEGVLYAEIAALANDGTNRAISISDGTTSNVVRFYYSVTDNRIVGNVKSGGSNVLNYNNVLSDATDFIKVAISYKADDYKMYVNGIEVTTDTSGAAPIGLTELAFDNGAGNDDFYGDCKALAVFDEALTDDELELLTGITNYGSFNELAQANSYTII